MRATWVKKLLRPLVAIVATSVVLWKCDPREVVRAALDARPGFLLVGLGLLVIDRALMAQRWTLLLRGLDPPSRPLRGGILRVFFVSTFVGAFLPASVGGDAYRVFGLTRLGVPAADSAASVVMDRTLGVVGLLVACTASIWLAWDLVGGAGWIASFLIVGAACIVIGALTLSATAAELARGWMLRLPGERLPRAGASLIAAIRRYDSHRGVLCAVLLGSVAVQLLRVSESYCLGRSLGIAAGYPVYLAFIPPIVLIALLPITIGGLGTTQIAFVALFSRVGVDPAQAFALSILFFAMGLLGDIPGGLFFLLRGRREVLPPLSAGGEQT